MMTVNSGIIVEQKSGLRFSSNTPSAQYERFINDVNTDQIEKIKSFLRTSTCLDHKAKDDGFKLAVEWKKYEVICAYVDVFGSAHKFYEELLKESLEKCDINTINNLIVLNPNLFSSCAGLVQESLVKLLEEAKRLNRSTENISSLLDIICELCSKISPSKENVVTERCRGEALILAADLDDQKKVNNLLAGNQPISKNNLIRACDCAGSQTRSIILKKIYPSVEKNEETEPATNYIYRYLCTHENDLESYSKFFQELFNNKEANKSIQEAFVLCSANGNYKAFEFMLNNTSVVTDESKELAFNTAVSHQNGEIVRVFEECKPGITSVFYSKLLNQSIKNNDDNLFDILIVMNPDLLQIGLSELLIQAMQLTQENPEFSTLLNAIYYICKKMPQDKENNAIKMKRDEALILVANTLGITNESYHKLLMQSLENKNLVLFDNIISMNPDLIQMGLSGLLMKAKELDLNCFEFPILLKRICDLCNKIPLDKENKTTKICRGNALYFAAMLDDQEKIDSLLERGLPIDQEELKKAYDVATDKTKAKIGTLEIKLERAAATAVKPVEGLFNTINKLAYFGLTKIING